MCVKYWNWNMFPIHCRIHHQIILLYYTCLAIDFRMRLYLNGGKCLISDVVNFKRRDAIITMPGKNETRQWFDGSVEFVWLAAMYAFNQGRWLYEYTRLLYTDATGKRRTTMNLLGHVALNVFQNYFQATVDTFDERILYCFLSIIEQVTWYSARS